MTLAARAEDARLRPDEFRLLRDLVNGYAGIYFGDEALPVLERRLKERLVALGLTRFNEYYQFLKFSNGASSELDEAVDLLTTNETYFFREDYQLRAFKSEVLPVLASDGNGRASSSRNENRGTGRGKPATAASTTFRISAQRTCTAGPGSS